MFLERTELLLGGEALERLRETHFLILGVGGVGGFAAEFLCRAGAGRLTLVDGDSVEDSNRNRQLVALSSTLGRPKVEVLRERLLDIAPECRVEAHCEFVADEKTEALFDLGFDCAVDAIDSLSPKAFFLAGCVRRNLPVVSSMGSGGRVDPAQVRFARLDKTCNCGLARALRKRLKSLGVEPRKIPCVFSPELVPNHAVRVEEAGAFKRSTVGTISYLPAVFGAFLAARALELVGTVKLAQ